MSGLAFNALRDSLAALQLRVDQLERNAITGTGIEYEPLFLINDVGVSCNSAGFWIRTGQGMAFWFYVEVTTVPFAGELKIGSPPDVSGGALELLGGLRVPYPIGVYSSVRFGAGTTYGWIDAIPDLSDFFKIMLRGEGIGYESTISPTALQVGDYFVGTALCKVRKRW